MTKTKTNRKNLIITSVVVALILIAAAFYLYAKNNFVYSPEIRSETVTDEINIAVVATEDENRTSYPKEHLSEIKDAKFEFEVLTASWSEYGLSQNIQFFVKAGYGEDLGDWLKIDKISDQKDGNDFNKYYPEAPLFLEGNRYQYKFVFLAPDTYVNNFQITYFKENKSWKDLVIEKISLIDNSRLAFAAGPTVITRSQWGCSDPDNTNFVGTNKYWPAQYGEKASKFIVHHTVTPSDDPAKRIRAIWYDHAVLRGWGDIGYNYIVDTNGNIYEGRYGGDAVVAGHARPYNFTNRVDGDGIIDEVSVGISVLGNYETSYPTSASVSALGRFIGYKSYVFDINPAAKSWFNRGIRLDYYNNADIGVYNYNIDGHKNFVNVVPEVAAKEATSCPGKNLGSKFSAIRSEASKIAFSYYVSLSSDLAVDPSTAVEGQLASANFIIQNTDDSPILLERIKIDVRDGSKIQDFAGFSNITIQPGESFTFDQSKIMSLAGSYKATIRIYANGSWHTPAGHTPKSLRVNPFDYSTVKLSKSLSFSSNRYVGEELTANFELENTNSFPVNLSRIKIDFRKPGTITDFMGTSNETISAKGKYAFSDTIIPISAGTYDARALYQYNGRWRSLAATKITINPSSIPTRIEASSLTLTNPSPMVGEEFGVSFYLTNNNPQAVTLDRLKVDIRGTSISQDIGGLNNVTIDPGSSAKVQFSGSDFSRFLTASGSYKGFLRFNYLGSWYTPRGDNTFSTSIKAFDPSLLTVSPGLQITPDNFSAGTEAGATFGIIYNRPHKLRLERLKIDVRDGLKSQDFLGVSNLILTSEKYLFSQSRIITESGNYSFNIRLMVAGRWYTPSGEASGSIKVSLQINYNDSSYALYSFLEKRTI